MRENMGLCRGKRKRDGKWIEGIYVPYNWNIFGERENIPQIIIISDDDNIDGLWCDIIPETVGQYTGLTDRNGTMIFEGDIVERVSDGERAVISWLKYSACFGLSFDGWCCGFDDYDFLPSDFEVVGNIIDNPELLERGEGDG